METNRPPLSQLKARPYTKNFDYFDNYLSNLRQHQVDAVLAACASNKGQIICPCGTGKTLIQIALHTEEMIRLNQDYEYGVFVIASHRLSLNRHLLNQAVDVIVNCGLSFDILYIGSYKCNLNKYYEKYRHLGYSAKVSNHLATTDRKQIEAFIQNARDNYRNVLVASTYDSFNALKNVGPINIITFDEAHNTTQDDFKKNILEVKPCIASEYYFTATRKVAGEDMGMNDKVFYGDILFDAFPRKMLEAGEIVAPKLHRIKGEEDQTTNATNTDMLVKNTIEAYSEHRNYVKKYSCSPENIGAKLLVGCDGIKEMMRIYDDPALKIFTANMQFFAISSDGAYVNGSPCSKEDFFTKLNDLSDAEDAIILNVDMLTEGIDLPSITGVMPLRNLGLTKLIQLIGRALRLHKMDRVKLYSNEIKPQDHASYVKPYGWFVVPQHLAAINHFEEMIAITKRFYEEYGTLPDQLVIEEKFIDHKAQQLPSMIPFNFKGGKDYDLEHEEASLIEEANLSLLKDMRKLSDAEFAQKIGIEL